jgi:competence protein ComEA
VRLLPRSDDDIARLRLAALTGTATPVVELADDSALDREGEPPPRDIVGALRDAARAKLPAGLRSAAADPGRRGAVALLGLALVVAAGTGVFLFLGRPRAVDVAAPAAVVSEARPSTAASLVVDVAGDVRRPGLVRLRAGARVADAVRAAGGALPGSDLDALNLARKVVDGEQIVVGAPVPTTSTGDTPAASGGVVSLNAATVEQLDGLPGVGPVLAQRIVSWREQHGAFASVDQLREVGGIGERKLADLRPLVTL